MQCFSILMVKNLFLRSSLNLPSLSLKPLLLVLLQQALLKIFSQSFLVGLLQVLKGCYKVSPQPSLLQAEQPQLSQPFLIGEVLQPSDHLCGLLWTHSNSSMSFLCWGLQNWRQDSRWGLTRAECRNHLPALKSWKRYFGRARLKSNNHLHLWHMWFTPYCSTNMTQFVSFTQ